MKHLSTKSIRNESVPALLDKLCYVEVESTSDERYITRNTPAKPMPISVGMLKSSGFFIARRQA